MNTVIGVFDLDVDIMIVSLSSLTCFTKNNYYEPIFFSLLVFHVHIAVFNLLNLQFVMI